MAAVIQNPLKALGDQFYQEAIEQCRSYNARLCAERSVRLPFLDSQTGVAQNNCYIWMERHHRSPGVSAGQMYTYPARCWRKKRRLHTSMDPRLGLCGLQLVFYYSQRALSSPSLLLRRLSTDLPHHRERDQRTLEDQWRTNGGVMSKDSLPNQSTTLEALLRGEGLDKRNNSKEEASLLEIQRVLEADAAEDAFHDDDDYEVDTPKRRHRGKGRGRGTGRRRTDRDDQDKPYVCDNRFKVKRNTKSSASVCGKRYRNRTGLSYHYTHSHLGERRASERGSGTRSPSTQRPDKHKRLKVPGGSSLSNSCSNCRGSHRRSGHPGQRGPCEACRLPAGCREKEERSLMGAEELFGTTSESDTSTFHGFEDDDLEELPSNGHGLASRPR